MNQPPHHSVPGSDKENQETATGNNTSQSQHSSNTAEQENIKLRDDIGLVLNGTKCPGEVSAAV